MDAATWLAENGTLQTEAQTFACLDGCGFCCTYPPQVSNERLAAISEATGLNRVTVDPQGRQRLPLQGGCGGCVLLEERECTGYQHRPRHCRLFPFHVYFGRAVEIHADAVCPGLDPAPGADAVVGPGPIREAIAGATQGVGTQELVDHRDQALAVHETFEDLAREAGVWQDPDQARAAVLDDAVITEAGWGAALAPFDRDTLDLVPTMVLPGPGYTWRMWRLTEDGFEHVTFEEDGSTTVVATSPRPERPQQLTGPAREVYQRLVGLECFIGSALDLVDASGYTQSVGQAVAELADEVAAGLAVREHLLEAEGLRVDQRWLAAAYEPDFFDLPTIGGWL